MSVCPGSVCFFGFFGCFTAPTHQHATRAAVYTALFNNFFIFSLSLSLLPPRPSFLSVPLSSSSLFPPRPSFLLAPPSSSSLLPPRPFFSVQQCQNHLKYNFSSILTDGPTDKAYRDADTSKNRRQKHTISIGSTDRGGVEYGVKGRES